METTGTAQPTNQTQQASQTLPAADGIAVDSTAFMEAANAANGQTTSDATQQTTTESSQQQSPEQTVESALDDLGIDSFETPSAEAKPTDTTKSVEAEAAKKVEVERRNYEGFDPEDAEVLRRLGNRDFNLVQQVARKYADRVKTTTAELNEVKKQYEQVKSGALPDTYYAHPEAYKLSPDYKNIVNEYTQAEQFENHYLTQLERIRSGQPWERVVSDGSGGYTTVEVPALPVDEATGAVKIDAQADVRVSSLLSQAARAKENAKLALSQLRGGFAAKHEQANSRLTELEAKIFPKFSGDNYEGKEQVDNIFKSLPVEAGSEVFRRMYAKGTVAFGKLALLYDALLKKQNGTVATQQQQRSGGPGPDDFVAGNNKPAAVTMTVDQALSELS